VSPCATAGCAGCGARSIRGIDDAATPWTSDDALDELYGVVPEEFVLVRSRLERELRAAGDADGAAALKRRRRPHLAAWACNQLSRTAPDAVVALLEATDAVAEAQRAALGGADPDELRVAGRRRQELLDELSDDAVRLLRGHAPKPDQYRDPVASTLDAASLDPDLTDDLRRGRLTQPLNPPAGFGPLVAVPSRARSAQAPAAPARRPSKRDVERAERDADRAQDAAVRATDAVGEAEARLASAELEVHGARAHLDEVERARERAKESLAGARTAVEQTQRELEDARRVAREAKLAAAEAAAALAAVRGPG
jgi:hypothetical protein